MINENIKATGELQIVLRDKNGNIKEDRTVKNLVVSTGKAFIASRMVGVANGVMSHMAVGTNNAAPNAGHTALLGEIGRAVLVSATSTDNVVTYSSLFAPGVGTGALTEAGIFNDASVGIMVARTVFSVVHKEADDSLTINWQISIS